MRHESFEPKDGNAASWNEGDNAPWPDFISGVRRFGYAVFCCCMGIGLIISATVNQYNLTSTNDNSTVVLLSGAIPIGVFVMIIAWNGPLRKRSWVFPLIFGLAPVVLVLSLIGQALFWIWAARLTPPFYLLNPAYIYNWPEMTVFGYAAGTAFSVITLIIGYCNRWFQGLW